MNSPVPVLLFVVPFLGALVCACLGWAYRPMARIVTLTTLLAGALLSGWSLAQVLDHGAVRCAMGGWRPPLGIEWVLDPVSGLAVFLVCGVLLFTVPNLCIELRKSASSREVSALACVLLLLSGLIGMLVSADLFNVFVHLEVASLSAYALVAAGGRGAPRAALRYLIMGSVGASLYLLGVGFVYAATGTLNMAEAAARMPSVPAPQLVLAGSAFIAIGLAVKMGLFPLHGWMPGAYAKSPAGAASVMAPLVTKVSAVVMLRILFWVFGAAYLRDQRMILELLGWGGALAMVFGSAMAFAQDDFRRLLAYSSVAQMGVVALGLAVANTSGLTGALLHIANDAVMKAALFVAAGALALHYGITRVDDLSRLRGRAPVLNAAIAIAGLSLVGIPPLCGFFGKWWTLSGALEAGRHAWAALLILGSLVSAAYVFRILEKLYFAKEELRSVPENGPRVAAWSCGALALTIVVLGLFSERVVSWAIVPALPAGL